MSWCVLSSLSVTKSSAMIRRKMSRENTFPGNVSREQQYLMDTEGEGEREKRGNSVSEYSSNAKELFAEGTEDIIL